MNKKEKMSENRKVNRILIHRKKDKPAVFRDVYIKIKSDAIDISDWKDFKFLVYFNFSELVGFNILEENGVVRKKEFQEKQ